MVDFVGQESLQPGAKGFWVAQTRQPDEGFEAGFLTLVFGQEAVAAGASHTVPQPRPMAFQQRIARFETAGVRALDQNCVRQLRQAWRLVTRQNCCVL